MFFNYLIRIYIAGAIILSGLAVYLYTHDAGPIAIGFTTAGIFFFLAWAWIATKLRNWWNKQSDQIKIKA